MISPLEFEGSWVMGPASFVKATGRNKVWAKKPTKYIERHSRGCPICGTRDAKTLFRSGPYSVEMNDSWDYSRCVSCGMIYTAVVPTEAAMAEVYKRGPAQTEWVKLQQNELETKLDRLKFQWALEWAGWADCEKRILDIGCSTGTLLSVAGGMIPKGTKNALLAGVEINQGALKVAAANLDFPGVAVITGADIENMKHVTVDGEPKKFGVVVLWEVLEHVLDPKAMLKEATDLLMPGGTILICVPNVNSLAAQILHERAPMFGLGHLNMFDTHGLVSLLPGFQDFTFTSIISWRKEITNWLNLQGPFDADSGQDPAWLPDARQILDALQGYKLVMAAEKAF
jgi:2-polyprenyl-3-methyl-5-hydroxy-6-metoxy-1,4-benzoquinol methylase